MNRLSAGLIAAAFAANYLVPYATASMISVNGSVKFASDYELDSPVSSAAFPDATGDYDPAIANVGVWTYAGESDPAQAQVVNLVTAGPFDPGPFQGSNYFRLVRTNTNPDRTLPEFEGSSSGSGLGTVAGDLVHAETAVYITSFPSTTSTIRFMSLTDPTDGAFDVVVGVKGDGTMLNGPASGSTSSAAAIAGPTFTFDAWHVVAIDYTVGSSTWTLTYDGTQYSGLASANTLGVFGLDLSGGAELNNGPIVYFDAVPEPSEFVLTGLACCGFATVMRKNREKSRRTIGRNVCGRARRLSCKEYLEK